VVAQTLQTDNKEVVSQSAMHPFQLVLLIFQWIHCVRYEINATYLLLVQGATQIPLQYWGAGREAKRILIWDLF
jgi:hypothetical protein